MRSAGFFNKRIGQCLALVLAVPVGVLGVAGEASAAKKSCLTHANGNTQNWCKVKHGKYLGVVRGKKAIALVQGRGPMTLTLTAIETVSNTRSSTVTVTAESISAAVGFDVTKSRTKSMSGSWNVPRGKFGTLKAYALYKKYSFKVYSKHNGHYEGKGVAYKAIGYRYTHSAR